MCSCHMISIAMETTPLISMCSACVFYFAAGSPRKKRQWCGMQWMQKQTKQKQNKTGEQEQNHFFKNWLSSYYNYLYIEKKLLATDSGFCTLEPWWCRIQEKVIIFLIWKLLVLLSPTPDSITRPGKRKERINGLKNNLYI